MCGIAGFFYAKSEGSPEDMASRMAGALKHRGPDVGGSWHDAESGVCLAHRRLSILDLSPAGNQPMSSPSGRFVMVFNGEIYNHLDLRNELAGQVFRGRSDAETLLAGFEAWGVERALERAVGMFALAVWDKTEKILVLARDRIGEKPLYYGWAGERFAFASELQAMRALPDFKNPINREALALFMRHNAVPDPYSIYEKIYKLRPGNLLALSYDDARRFRLPGQKAYWRLLDSVKKGEEQPLEFGSDADAADALQKALMKSVQGQMIADVPLGAFLSGGVDSSLIVALMQAQSTLPVKTFTIGFHEHGFDEAPFAKAVARHLGTEHEELYVTDSDALAVIPKLPSIYAEPFSDSSQIPTFLLSQMVRKNVTVALSGDGGDEMFGGYERYFISGRLWQKVSAIPKPLRQWAGMLVRAVPVEAWNNLSPLVSPLLPRSRYTNMAGDRLHKGALMLGSSDGGSFYINGFMSHWNPGTVVLGASDVSTPLKEAWTMLSGFPTFMEQMMMLDALTYLPNDCLVKVDRAAMAVSLETRAPFLDYRIAELAWRMPLHYKVRKGAGKWIVREVLKRFIPQQCIDRPKMGFGVPLNSWLRGPLREWAEDLLDENRLKREGYLNHGPIRKKWSEHLAGRRNWQAHLWDVLMFQSWLAEQAH